MKRTTQGTFGIAAATSIALIGAVAAFAADQTPAPAGDAGKDQRRSAFREACGADLQKFCAPSTTREERRACVTANKDKFSDSCKKFMADHPRGHGKGDGQSSQGQ